MTLIGFLVFIIVLYILFDINYVIRTVFSVLCGLMMSKCSLNDTTSIYGICTFQDCNVYFRKIRLARLVRDLDFARYNFYVRTGIYRRSRQENIRSLQRSTLTVTLEHIPLFLPYRISTELVYWDDRSLFLEHKVTTVHDNKVRYFLVSRQYAIGKKKTTVETLLRDLEGSDRDQVCPDYIRSWLCSMQASSDQLKQIPATLRDETKVL